MALTLDQILDGAREKSGGLADPECDSWREGLEILLRDHARENRLTERGWQGVRQRYVNCLAARMAVDDHLRRHPELADAPIERPVFNDNDVREMADRLLPQMRAGSILAIHSTIHPDTCRAIATEAARRGIHVLDAPVSGGSPAAEAGKLTVMAGGDAEVLARARPVFETFGALIVHLGDVGAGQYVKLINNSLFVANLGLADAALDAADALGIDRSSFIDLLKASSGRSFAFDVRARMESPAGFRHGGALLRKDIGLLGEVLGTGHPAAERLGHAAEGFLQAAAGTGGR